MKNVRILLLFLFIGMAQAGFSQTVTPPDFFAGKWEISAVGTPVGDVKFTTDLVRKAGKLTGELTNAADPGQANRPLIRVEEKGDKVVMYFESSQGGEVPIELTKVDDNNLKGTLSTFDATAKRLKP
ncbi:hypothetical protein G8759_29500 [Spirosoma aureum]|uniref:TIGR03067 domain-containing protein n=1 Tax=Spirosoma aureum TaxID=2692134 RepID=A0A6G9AVU9_9BACT|nr:hypothetical protein [Spirosoma aureum]QIP16488.1 hypothetical protein G8759_29500 [Spirosoma aureum]